MGGISAEFLTITVAGITSIGPVARGNSELRHRNRKVLAHPASPEILVWWVLFFAERP
jgi:hypothetical protein